MNRNFVVVLLVTAPLLAICEMLCYSCESRKSLEDCENNQNPTMGCIIKDNRSLSCYVFQSHAKDGEMRYGKDCIVTDNCNPSNGCSADPAHCEVHCCSTPLCNKHINKAPSLKVTTVFPAVVLVTMIFCIVQVIFL